MKKYLALLLLAVGLYSNPVFANTPSVSVKNIQSIDVSNLTPEQKAQLMTQAAQLQKEQPVAEAKNVSETVRAEASEWANLGSNVGKAAVSAAKELGIAANDFVQTPLGKMTMFIVIYKVIGASVLKIILGTAILVVFLGTSLYLVFKKKYAHVEYQVVPGIFGLGNKRIVSKYTTDESLTLSHYLGAMATTIIGLITGLSIIF